MMILNDVETLVISTTIGPVYVKNNWQPFSVGCLSMPSFRVRGCRFAATLFVVALLFFSVRLLLAHSSRVLS